jgi:hypothetical protein
MLIGHFGACAQRLDRCAGPSAKSDRTCRSSCLANLSGVHKLGCMGMAVEELTRRCLVAAHAATHAALMPHDSVPTRTARPTVSASVL